MSMARRGASSCRFGGAAPALRTLCVLALARGASAGIFNVFQQSPPPGPAPPAPPPACPAASYQFSTAWIAPVVASVATRLGMPAASAQVAAASLLASIAPQLTPLVGTCQPCSPGCASCTSAAMCTTCAAGFSKAAFATLADGLLGTPPAAPPPPVAVASALAAAALQASAAAGNVTLCLPQTAGYGLEGVLGAAACAVLPASAAALFPACAAAPTPLPGARVVGNSSSNATAPPVSALAGPPASASTWLAAAQAVTSAATPLARVAAASTAASSVLTATSITLVDPRLLSGAAEPAKLLEQAASLASPALAALSLPSSAGAVLNASLAMLARQSVQLYVSCNAAPLPHNASAAAAAAPTPLLRSAFWALVPGEVQAAGVPYAKTLPLGVWPAGGNMSAVLCLLYQWNVLDQAPRAVGAATVLRSNFTVAAPKLNISFTPIAGHPLSGAGNATAMVARLTLSCPGCALNASAANVSGEVVVARLLNNAVATYVASNNATSRSWSWSLTSLLGARNATASPPPPPPRPPAISALAGPPASNGVSQLLILLFGGMIPPPPPRPPPSPLPPPPMPPPSPMPPPLSVSPPPLPSPQVAPAPASPPPAAPPPSISPPPTPAASPPPQSYGINSVVAASPPPVAAVARPPPSPPSPPSPPPPQPPQPPPPPPPSPSPPPPVEQAAAQPAAEQSPALASAPASMTAPAPNVSDRGRRTALIAVCAVFGCAVCALGGFLMLRRCCCGSERAPSPRMPFSARGRAAPPGGAPTRTWQMPSVVADWSPRRRESLTGVARGGGRETSPAPASASRAGRTSKNSLVAAEV